MLTRQNVPSPMRSHLVSDVGSHEESSLSDAQFRRLAKDFAQIVWRRSADGASVIAPRFVELTGQSERELQGDGWLSAVHPEDRPATSMAWREALQTGGVYRADYRLRMRNGTYRWFRAQGEPTRNSRGAVVAWVGVTTNIDEQKRAETALSESEARWRLAIDAARVGTFEWDVNAGSARVSPRTCEIVGVTAVDAIEITAFEALVHPDDRLRVHDALRATLDPNAPLSFRMIFRAVRGDGDIAWVGLRGATLCSGAGRDRRPDRCLAAVVDLTTEFRELEERARLAAIVTSSDDAITAERLDGTVTHWNPAAERMFGFTAREMLGQSVIPLLPPELAEEEQALFASMRTGHAVSGHPTERLTRAGRRIAVSVTMSPIRNDAGEIVGVSSITRDETAHRALEQQYRQAQKLEAIGQLAGGVAHDLNNILTVVSGGVEFALESPSLDDVSRGDLIAVRTECFRAAGIIRQLLTFGRQQPMAPRTLALNEIIQDLRPMLARLLNEDVTLETELHATGGVLADREQVVQVLLNLAVNARDAMSRGGTLTMGTIDADGTADRGDSVVLRVSDTGCGMSDEVKAHVFEPFFTTKPVGCGTGLGLATVYGIVAQCHGTVSVESTVGQGTTFTIVFPRASVPPTVTPTPDDQVPADVRGNETILVVEDETVLRNQIARALRGAGYRVLEGRNGNDALIALEHHGAPVHLVVSDVVMPEMSGGELVAQLREWYPRLKVLFISGYSQEAVRRYGVGVAESAVLPKPFELRQLCRRIRAVLDGPRVATDDAQAELLYATPNLPA